MMKISVVMVDGGFRENTFGARYFSEQDFSAVEYEVIWVDYYDRPHEDLRKYPGVKVIALGRTGEYHSSYCFNKGIVESRGELLVIPDADQIVKPDFLSRVWETHAHCDRFVVYGYRYDERKEGSLPSLEFSELEEKCALLNPENYGGCLTVRKKWLFEVNGYEQHEVFSSGYHANGKDLYTRFKNLGLAVMWEPRLKLFHPYHSLTRACSKSYEPQLRFIEWRRRTLHTTAFEGLVQRKNSPLPDALLRTLREERDISADGSGKLKRYWQSLRKRAAL